MFAATYFIIYYIQFLQQHPLKIIQFWTKIFVVVIIYRVSQKKVGSQKVCILL